MEMDLLLNILFAVVISGLGWWLKSQHEEIKRVTILLNRTREEFGRDYVSKADSNQVLMQIMNKFDKLETQPTELSRNALRMGVRLAGLSAKLVNSYPPKTN